MTAKMLVPLMAAAALLPAAEKVTFTQTIAPILYENCVTCHRPGEAAPFPLLSYEDVKKRGALIATVTQSRYMPPWHTEHAYGEFAGERRLSDKQIAAISDWVKQGMPQGGASNMPRLPEFTEGWHLGKPDLVLEMPVGYELPASGPDVFRNFTIPVNLKEDKWIRAVEFRPSARKAAHHALFAYVRSGSTASREGADGKPGFGGMGTVGVTPGQNTSGSLGGWAVGGTPVFLPEGLAMPLPKGSDFLLQMHFHPTGKPETEKSLVGLYFAEKAPARKMITIGAPGLFGVGAGIDIPAGEKNFTIRDSYTLPADVTAYSAVAHAHYLAKDMKAAAVLPDGSTRPLIHLPDWDFNWQETYNYQRPFVLPKGTRIDVSIQYDNSADNPRNPSNPPKRTQFGEESFDEMGMVGIVVTAVHTEDEELLQKSLVEQAQGAIRKGLADGTVKRYMENQVLRRPAAVTRTEITILDPQGKVLGTVGEPAAYSHAAFSPDGTRVAVIKNDRETTDVWVFDVATGKATRLTSGGPAHATPVWSPDGKQLAYAAIYSDQNYSAIFRKAADGSGNEELVYRHPPGAAVSVTDWSSQGLVCFWAGDALYTMAIGGDRKPVELVHDRFSTRSGRFSPDGGWIAYSTNASGRFEVWVAPLHGAALAGKPVQVSRDGALGGTFWRQDGKELYFLTLVGLAPGPEMAVDLTLEPELQASAPRVLFRPGGISSPGQLSNIATPDGQRFVFLRPVAAMPVARSANAH